MIDQGNPSYRWGDGLFETLRVEDGRMVRREAHLERLRTSMEFLGYPARLMARVDAALDAETWDDGLVRVTLSRVGGPFDIPERDDTVCATWRAFPRRRAVRLLPVEGWYLPDDVLAEHKTTSYLRRIELRRRALEAGFDDGLGVSRDGRVGEAATANVFVLGPDERWATPEVRGILPGTTRRALIDTLEAVGEPVVERALELPKLSSARAVVLTSSGVVVGPVSQVGMSPIPDSSAQAERLRRLLQESA